MTHLATWLKEHNKTAAELARLIGQSKSAVHRIVTGERQPSPKMAQKLADVTGIPIGQLRPDLAQMFRPEQAAE